MAMKTPEKQILPIAPITSDTMKLARWGGDLTRSLHQNLASIARKANDDSNFVPIADFDMQGFDIINAGNISADSFTFPATAVPSADPNTLDDYEEGAWTPSISFGLGQVGQTYSSQIGGYIKIGKLVFVRFRIAFTAKGSSTGNVALEGLPFSIGGGQGGAVNVGFYNNMALPNPGIVGFMSSGTSITLRNQSTTTTTTLTDAHFTNTSLLIGGFAYEASS